MICTNCQYENNDPRNSFCGGCGTKFGEKETTVSSKEVSEFYNFKDDLQVGVDRILRDKGMSNIDIWEAIESVLAELKSKYRVVPTPSPSTTVKEEKNISRGLNFSDKVMKIWESTKHDAIVRTKKHVGYSSDDLSEILEIAKDLSFEPGAGTKIKQ